MRQLSQGRPQLINAGHSVPGLTHRALESFSPNLNQTELFFGIAHQSLWQGI